MHRPAAYRTRKPWIPLSVALALGSGTTGAEASPKNIGWAQSELTRSRPVAEVSSSAAILPLRGDDLTGCRSCDARFEGEAYGRITAYRQIATSTLSDQLKGLPFPTTPGPPPDPRLDCASSEIRSKVREGVEAALARSGMAGMLDPSLLDLLQSARGGPTAAVVEALRQRAPGIAIQGCEVIIPHLDGPVMSTVIFINPNTGGFGGVTFNIGVPNLTATYGDAEI